MRGNESWGWWTGVIVALAVNVIIGLRVASTPVCLLADVATGLGLPFLFGMLGRIADALKNGAQGGSA